MAASLLPGQPCIVNLSCPLDRSYCCVVRLTGLTSSSPAAAAAVDSGRGQTNRMTGTDSCRGRAWWTASASLALLAPMSEPQQNVSGPYGLWDWDGRCQPGMPRAGSSVWVALDCSAISFGCNVV